MRKKIFAVLAVVVALSSGTAHANASKQSSEFCDGSVGYCLQSFVEEANAGQFRAHARVRDTWGSASYNYAVYTVLYQCDGTGNNCGQIAANNSTSVPVYVPAFGTGDLYTSWKVGAFGHTYKVCSSISGSTLLNICTPLMAYTTI